MATSKFARYFLNAGTKEPVTLATIWLVPQANTYPTGALALTKHATRTGVYYRDAVPDGEYKVYVDPAGGSSPTLYDEHLWLGEQKISRTVSIRNQSIFQDEYLSFTWTPNSSSGNSELSWDAFFVFNGQGKFNQVVAGSIEVPNGTYCAIYLDYSELGQNFSLAYTNVKYCDIAGTSTADGPDKVILGIAYNSKFIKRLSFNLITKGVNSTFAEFNPRNQGLFHSYGEEHFTWTRGITNSVLSWGKFFILNGQGKYNQVLAGSISVPNAYYCAIYLDCSEIISDLAVAYTNIKYIEAVTSDITYDAGKVVLGFSFGGEFSPRLAGLDVDIVKSSIKANSIIESMKPEDYKTIVFMGDSITLGSGASDGAHQWIKVFQGAMFGAGFTAIETNDAVAGNTLTDMLMRLAGLSGGDVVCILAGMNDLRKGLNWDSHGKKSLTSLINFYKMDSKIILVGSTYPLTAYGYTLDPPFNQGSLELCDEWAVGIRELCLELGVIYVPTYELWNNDSSLISGDNVHPKDAGHTIIAQSFWYAFYAYINDYKNVKVLSSAKEVNEVPVANAGFEDGTISWSGFDSTIAEELTTKRTGLKSIAVTTTNANGTLVYTASGGAPPFLPIKPNTQYYGECWVRMDSGSANLKIQYINYDVSSVLGSWAYGFTKVVDDTKWFRLTFAMTSDADSVGLQFNVVCESNGVKFYVDDVSIWSVNKI